MTSIANSLTIMDHAEGRLTAADNDDIESVSSSSSPQSSAFASTSASTSSSPASSPALSPCSLPDIESPISLDDDCLPSAKPTSHELTEYAASIIRKEAYALLALAARLQPTSVQQPVSIVAKPADAEAAARLVRHESSRTNAAFRVTVEALSELPPHGKILVTGVGKSGIVGKKMVATFNSLGIPAAFLHPLEALHGDLGCICPCSPATDKKCDALLMISHSGATAELMRLLPVVRSRVRALVAVTRDPESVLARACGHWLDAGTGATCGPVKDGEKVTDEADSALPAPTSSVVTALAVGDALALSLSRIRLGWEKGGKERRADFLRCHPGGQLGIELGREERGVLSSLTASS